MFNECDNADCVQIELNLTKPNGCPDFLQFDKTISLTRSALGRDLFSLFILTWNSNRKPSNAELFIACVLQRPMESSLVLACSFPPLSILFFSPLHFPSFIPFLRLSLSLSLKPLQAPVLRRSHSCRGPFPGTGPSHPPFVVRLSPDTRPD